MQITKHAVVSIDYKLTNPSGEVLDQSPAGQPLTYLHGVGGLLAGLEAALEGKSAGESVSVTIPPERGYGVRDEKLKSVVERGAFGKNARVEHGTQFRATVAGQQRVVTITGFDKDGRVRIDANHPLAGETLHFDVRIAAVREATAEEVRHGHVHGPGGHQH